MAKAIDPTEDPWQAALDASQSAVEEARAEYQTRAVQVDRECREALLPPPETADRIARYETTQERSLSRTLNELRRLQAARSGVTVPVPPIVDIDLSVNHEKRGPSRDGLAAKK